MNINQKLDWKQVVLVVFALWVFGKFFTPIQFFVLGHPFVGLIILVALVASWFLFRKFKQKGQPA